MAGLKDFKQISNIYGIDQYILVNQTAGIIIHDIKKPEKMAEMVFTCGQNGFAIGKNQFKYLIVSRKNKKNFFIFPVGKYYLGVVKQKNIDDFLLVGNVIKFIQGLA